MYTDSNEGALFVLGQFQSTTITTAEYTTFLHDNFGSAAPLVAQAYPIAAFNSSPFPAFTAMAEIITDVSYFCPAYRALNLAVQNGIPAWTYLFNHTPSCAWFNFIPQQALELLGATHTAEIPFVFGNLDNLPLPNGTCNLTTSELDISDTLISAWTAMAATGNPSPDSGLQWPSYNTSHSLGVNIDNSTTVGVVDYTACKFWDTLDATVLNFTAGNATTTTGPPSATSALSVASRSMSLPQIGVKIVMLAMFGGLMAFL